MASWVLTHDFNGEVQGLNEFKDARPPVAIVFWSFRIMVGVGLLMIAISAWCALTLLRKKEITGNMLRALSWMTFSGWVASLAGWYVTEIGRQPFIVYGQIRVADVAADHPTEHIAITLVTYILIYSFLLYSYIATLRHLSTKPAASVKLIRETDLITAKG